MTVVRTESGDVEGTAGTGCSVFLGVPYGAGVDGAGRFLPPQPATPWTGILSAKQAPPRAPQHLQHGSTGEIEEDCLRLNVWTPGTRGGRRPVLVWFHGGGFFSGSGLTPHTEGSALAAEQDVVVVSVNHRLGLLGFVDFSEVGGEEWGFEANPSILDLVRALTWVRDNIAAFGGDPGNVTIFGHSGGGGKVAAVLTSPMARGLVHKAVIHGGPPFGFKDAAQAAGTASQVLHTLEIDGGDLAALQAVPLERILQVQAGLGVGAVPTENGMLFGPVIGTASLPAFPEEALAAGACREIPLLTGTTIDEARFILVGAPAWLDPSRDITADQALRIVEAGVDNRADAERLWDSFRAEDTSSRLVDTALRILSEQFVIRTHRMAAAHRSGGGQVHSYLCTLGHDSELGSIHGTEMPVFFGNIGAGQHPLNSPGTRAARGRLMAALAAFARNGAPTGGISSWEGWSPEQPQQLVVAEEGLEMSDQAARDVMTAWDGVVVSSRQDPWGRAIELIGSAA